MMLKTLKVELAIAKAAQADIAQVHLLDAS